MVSVGCGVYPAAHIGNTDLMPAISKNIFKMVAEAPSCLKHLVHLFTTAVSVFVCVCVCVFVCVSVCESVCCVPACMSN